MVQAPVPPASALPTRVHEVASIERSRVTVAPMKGDPSALRSVPLIATGLPQPGVSAE
jgi:hypothetical protein